MDDCTQSSIAGALSEFVIDNQSIDGELLSVRSKKNAAFKKNDWLTKYFKYEKQNGKILTVCLGCKKRWISRSHPRMANHIKNCLESFDENMPVTLEDPQTTNSITSNQFAKALVDAGWTLNGTESVEFKKFIARLNSQWKIPSRHDLSAVYIPRLSSQLQKKFRESLNGNTYITIEFDHWEDANNRSFLGILATSNSGERHLLDLRDVSLKGHHSNVIVEEIIDVLKTLPPKSINSVISDSASTCKKAREEIVKKPGLKHLIQHRCLAHFVNLIGSRITGKNERISELVRTASKVTGIISSSSFWTAYLKGLDYRKTQTACPVRWYSMVTMLTALLELKNVILEDIVPKIDRDKAILILTLEWDQISELLDVLRPLADCIGEIEKRDCSLGEGIKHILDYAKQLFGEDSDCNSGTGSDNSVSEAKMEARKAFLFYFNESKLGREEMSLYLAAYALDRRFKLDYISPEGIELCLEAMARIAIKTGATLEQVKASIRIEFDYYRFFKGEYTMTDSKPLRWWEERINCGILSRIGLRLAHLRASSANIERTFSSIKYIQGDYRLNMSKTTLVHIARLKISQKDKQNESHQVVSDYWVDEPTITEPYSSLDDSIRSDSQNSSITFHTNDTNWIEEQEVITKKNYQSFFGYIDFSIKTDCTRPVENNVEEVTEADIRNCIRSTINPTYISEIVIENEFNQEEDMDATLDDY